MKQGPSPILWIVAAVVLSAFTSFFVAQFAASKTGRGQSDLLTKSSPDFHEWLHAELEITPEQEKALSKIETSFERDRIELLERIRVAGQSLASTLEAKPDDSASINNCLREINSAQGELQQVMIAHFLDMKEHLSPSQATRLLQWTRESITHDR